jgi:DNA-directed RNA polymerase specialized sigma24 family protein
MRDTSCFPFRSEAHYHSLRTKLVAFFDRRRCASSEELADESLLRLVKIAARRDVANVDATAFRIGKNVFRESLRQSARVVGLDYDPPDNSIQGNQSFRFIAEASLSGLRPLDRDLLERYFIEGEKAERLASQLGITPSGVRGRVFRLKRQLCNVVDQMLAGDSPVAASCLRPSA